MRAKIYNKKKLFSLLILPFMASNITAKSTLAASSTQLYNGDVYHVSGIHDSYRIFSYDTDVTVILDAAAQINNDSSSAAVGLNYGSSVDMKTGSAITSLPVEGNATGVEFDNELGYSSGITDNVTMDRSTIAATAKYGSAYGILSRPGSNDHNSHVTTQITLDNNSAITADGYGQAAGIYLAGHPGDLSPYNSSAIALDHGSSITATSYTYGDNAMASGIFIKDEGEVSISLDNGARISNSATSTTPGIAVVDNTHGIYAESVHSASSTVSLDHGSTVITTASATADKYVVIQSVNGVQAINNDTGNVSVTLANGSSITDTTAATIENTETSSVTRAVTNNSSGINAYSYDGNTTVTLGGSSTITVSATADNQQAGSGADLAYATNIYGIRSRSEYGDNSVTLGALSAVKVDAMASAQTLAITDAVGVSSIASGNEGSSNGDATLVMTQGASVATTAESTAIAEGIASLPGHAYTSAMGANIYADDGDIHVILNNASVSAEGAGTVIAAAGAPTTSARTWSGAEGIHAEAGRGGQTVVDLSNGTVVSATATAVNDSLASAKYSNSNSAGANATGIYAYSDWGQVDVTLDSATVAANATATAKGNDHSSNNFADTFAYGLVASSDTDRVRVKLSNSTITVNATTTADAWAGAEGRGIMAYNDYRYGSRDSGATVTLNASSVAVNATATSTGAGTDSNPIASATVYGIYAQSSDRYAPSGQTFVDAAVTLNNLSQVAVTATATSAAGAAYAEANGVEAKSDFSADADVTVTGNSSIIAKAYATSATSAKVPIVDATANGILALGAEGASIQLADSSVLAAATASTPGASFTNATSWGTYAKAEDDNDAARITLDNSTVNATATASGAMTAPAAPVGFTTVTSVRPVWTDAAAYGIDIYSWGETDSAKLTNSQVNASAAATGFLTSAEAYGIRVNGHTSSWDPTDANVTLDHSSVTAQATATAAGSVLPKYNYAGATGILASNLGTSTIELSNGSSLTATAIGTNVAADGTGGDMYSYALGIASAAFAEAFTGQYYQSTAESNITLNNATVGVTATTTADDKARAYAHGLRSSTDGRSYQYSTNAYADSAAYTTVELTSSTLAVTATATGRDQAEAIARGLDSYANTHSNSHNMLVEADISNTIALDNSRLNSQATASGTNWTNAYASGISGVDTNYKFSFDNSSYGNSDLTISLGNSSAVSATAVSTSSSGNAWAKAVGINATNTSYATAWVYWPGTDSYDHLSISLINSTLSASGTATAGGDGGEGTAIAIQAHSETKGVGTTTYARDESSIQIALDHAALSATGSFSGYSGTARATGIDSDSLAGAYAHSNAEGGYAWSATDITLDNVTFAATASAISTAIGNTKAYATGITVADGAEGGGSTFNSRYSYADSSANIALGYTVFTAAATARGADALANAEGIYAKSNTTAWSDMTWVEAYGTSNITLGNSTFTTTASATGTQDVAALAKGIYSMADSRSDGDRNTSKYNATAGADTTVNLSNSTLTVAATANSTGHGYASSQGIGTGSYAGSDSRMPTYARAGSTVTLDNSRLTSQATATGELFGASAYAGGIDAGASSDAYSSLRNSHAESTLEITLSNNSSVIATATAMGPTDSQSHAEAVGIKGNAYAYSNAEGWDQNTGAEGHADLTISLDHSQVSATATASGYGKYYNSYAEATAITADATSDSYGEYTYADIDSTLNIDLNNATVTATADFTGDRGWSRAIGISTDVTAEADSGSNDNYGMTAYAFTGINLDTVTLSASASNTGNYGSAGAVGINAYAGARSGYSSSFYSGAAYAGATLDITLNAATLSVGASATGDYSSAAATGIDAYSHANAEGGHYNGEGTTYYSATSYTSLNIDLTDSKITTAASTAGASAAASAQGIYAYAYSDSNNYVAYSSDATTITLSNSGVGATATATGSKYVSAEAAAIDAVSFSRSDSDGRDPFYNTYADSYMKVALPGATLSATAAANSTDQANARSQGLQSNSTSRNYSSSPANTHADNYVTLDHTNLTSQATATGGLYAGAEAYGISTWGGASSRSFSYNAAAESTIDLKVKNGSVNTSAAAFSGGAEGCATAVAIQASSWATSIAQDNGGDYDGAEARANLAITLDHAQVSASASANSVGSNKYHSYAYATALEAGTSAYANGNLTDARIYSLDGDTRLPGVNLTIDLNNANLSSAANLTGQYGDAMATAVDAYSSARAVSGQNYYAMDAKSGSRINLDTVTLSASAVATGYADYATAAALRASDRVYSGRWTSTNHEGNAYAASQLGIDLAKSTATAAATVTGAEGFAEATGIDAYSHAYADAGHYSGEGTFFYTAATTSTVDLHLLDSTVSASASASGSYSDAEAWGLKAEAGAESNKYVADSSSSLLIDLDKSSVAATASASGDGRDKYLGRIYATAYGLAAISYAASNWTEKYSNAATTITLSDSSITASAAANGCYGLAEASGIFAFTYSDTPFSANKYDATSTSIDLTNSSVAATATANGYQGEAYARAIGVGPQIVRGPVLGPGTLTAMNGASNSANIGPFGNDIHTSINLTNSQVSAEATATGDQGYAAAFGISTFLNSDVQITLDNAAISAKATGNSSNGGGNATGILAILADNVTINLSNNSSIDATGSGNNRTISPAGIGPVGGGTGIALLGITSATINVDATSSISGSNYAVSAMSPNATLNNYGHIAGRVNVTTLNNLATEATSSIGTLQATLAGNDQEWWSATTMEDGTTTYIANPGDPFYFTATGAATLADGTTFRIAANGNLGFTAVDQVKEYRLLGVGNGIVTNDVVTPWDPTKLNIVKYGYQSPLLQYSYDEVLSDSDHIILKVKLLSPAEAGLSGNADGAVQAALADGILDFNSDPEQWSPEVMSKVFGSMQFIRGNLRNIENRLHGKHSGANSGDPNAKNHAWFDANYADATQDIRDGIEGFDTTTKAFNLGFDRNLSADGLIGLSFGYGKTDAETEISRRTLDMDEYMLSLYGQAKGQGWFGEGQVSAGWGSTDSLRYVNTTAYSASFDSTSYYAKLTGGAEIVSGGWSIMPKASIDYASIKFDEYSETGGPLALMVDSDTYNSSNIGAGLKAMYKGQLVTPEVGAMVYYDLIGDTIQTTSRFNGGSTYFQTKGAEPARTSWELSAGLNFEAPGTPITFKVGYDMLGRADFISHNFSGKLTFDF